jgi:glycine reductase complex component B subunit gamma
MIRVVHYVNRFLGEIGREEKTDICPITVEGAIGPGMLIDRYLDGRGKVVSTVICGDNYFALKQKTAVRKVLEFVRRAKADIFIAGPVFDMSPYGRVCGELCRVISHELGIPAIAGMPVESPAVSIYRRHVLIVETTGEVADMADAISGMVRIALKMKEGRPLGSPSEEGYVPRGFKENIVVDTLAAERAIDLLMKKMRGEAVVSEISGKNDKGRNQDLSWHRDAAKVR